MAATATSAQAPAAPYTTERAVAMRLTTDSAVAVFSEKRTLAQPLPQPPPLLGRKVLLSTEDNSQSAGPKSDRNIPKRRRRQKSSLPRPRPMNRREHRCPIPRLRLFSMFPGAIPLRQGKLHPQAPLNTQRTLVFQGSGCAQRSTNTKCSG